MISFSHFQDAIQNQFANHKEFQKNLLAAGTEVTKDNIVKHTIF